MIVKISVDVNEDGQLTVKTKEGEYPPCVFSRTISFGIAKEILEKQGYKFPEAESAENNF